MVLLDVGSVEHHCRVDMPRYHNKGVEHEHMLQMEMALEAVVVPRTASHCGHIASTANRFPSPSRSCEPSACRQDQGRFTVVFVPQRPMLRVASGRRGQHLRFGRPTDLTHFSVHKELCEAAPKRPRTLSQP